MYAFFFLSRLQIKTLLPYNCVKRSLKGTLKNMAQTILTTDQIESRVLGKDWYGLYQLGCMVYTSHPVKLEFRNPDHSTRGDTWIVARFNGTEIVFQAAGDVFDFRFTKGFEYRFVTQTAGAEIDIDKHDLHG